MEISKKLKNSLIIGGIAGFACFSGVGFSVEVLWSAFVAFGMAFLVECGHQYGTSNVKGKKGNGTFFF